MMASKLFYYAFRVSIINIITLSMTGCALEVSTKAQTETHYEDRAELSKDILVTLGKRRLLDVVSKKIMDSHADIDVIDGLLFRDTAFPEGGWRLEQLLVEQTRDRLRQNLGVDYLVLIGPLELKWEKSNDAFIPIIVGTFGNEGKAGISAVILDVQLGNLIKKIDTIAKGKSQTVYYYFFMAHYNPEFELSSVERLTEGIAQTLTTLKPSGQIRIAVMAAEPGLIVEKVQPEKLQSESNETIQNSKN